MRPAGSEQLGTKTELKNMNSFRFLQRGVEAELERQRELIEAGGTVTQETLHFDPPSGTLTSLRSKEEAHDYRYFPEPDLVPLAPTEEMLREAREALPELPAARIERYVGELGLAADVADAVGGRSRDRRLTSSSANEPRPGSRARGGRQLGDRRAGGGAAPGRGRGRRRRLEGRARRAGRPGRDWSQEKKISHGSGKTVLAALVAEGGDPAAIVEREGLAQMSDGGELEAIVAAAIEANPEAAEQIRDRQRQGDRRHRRRRDEGDQGPRRRRRGQPPDPGAARALE